MKVNKALMKAARNSGIRPRDVEDTWRYAYVESAYSPEKAVRQYHYDSFQNDTTLRYSIWTSGLSALVGLGGIFVLGLSGSGEPPNYKVAQVGAMMLMGGCCGALLCIPWSAGVCAVGNIKRRVVDGLPNYRKYREIAKRNESKLVGAENDSR